MFSVNLAECEDQKIVWNHDLAQAKKQAYMSNKPLIILFSDRKNCLWCQKLHEEILENPEFIQDTSDRYIFFHGDLSLEKYPEEWESFLDEYQIEAIPTLVLLTNQAKHISTIGYLPITGKKYATLLNQISQDYQDISNKLEENPQIELKELTSYILKAKQLESLYFRHELIHREVKKENYCLLLLEKYRLLLARPIKHAKQLLGIKKQISKIDPNNHTKAQRQLAILDFISLAKQKVGERTQEPILPLVSYIKAFGPTDKENLWKLQMMVCYFYQNQMQWDKALDYARDAYKAAPIVARKDIGKLMRHLRKKSYPRPYHN